MSKLLYRLGHGSVRHRWPVLIGWIIVLVGIVVGAGRWGGDTVESFVIPGTDSQAALDLLDERFPSVTGSNAQVVFASPDGSPLTDPSNRGAVAAAITAMADAPGVVEASNPFVFDDIRTGLAELGDELEGLTNEQLLALFDSLDIDPAEITTGFEHAGIGREPIELDVDDLWAGLSALGDEIDAFLTDLEAMSLSADRTVAYSTVHYAVSAPEVPAADIRALQDSVGPATDAGIQVEFGGEVHEREDLGNTSELIGLAVAVLVLLFSFGSVLAMGLPLGSALVGVGIGLSGITLFAGFTDLSSTAPILATMIGLAVGIDYALFIVTRHRQNLALGHSVAESAARANATAGGAVVFAGVTVVIALAALAVIGIPFLTVMGLAASATVLIAVLIAVNLLPALLGFAGHNIDRWRIGKPKTGSADEAENSLSARWSARVINRPAVALVGGLIVMILLAVPVLDMRLGMPDAGTEPDSMSSRRAYDLIADGFGPGFNGQMSAVVDLAGADAAGAEAVADAIAADDGVHKVLPPTLNEAGDTAVVLFVPETSPAAAETEDLVHRLRSDVLPPIADAAGVDVFLAGQTTVLIDMADKMGAALPVFMAIVIGLTMILLLAVFRSIVVPIKAAIAILLSIASAFGVVVAIFQWGWFANLIGVHGEIPIISFLPMLMFAVLFGLSMDYEVFILSRVREDYTASGDARASVLSGLTSSARVITAAALIMISVFASFIIGDDPTVKMMGLGFSVAVLLDATVVRMMLVPSVMALFGDRAWWIPARLDRIMPDFDVEGAHLIEALDEALEAGPAGAATAGAVSGEDGGHGVRTSGEPGGEPFDSTDDEAAGTPGRSDGDDDPTATTAELV